MQDPWIWWCNPEENTECPKIGCHLNGGLCKCTSKPGCALLNERHQPACIGRASKNPLDPYDGDNSGKKLNGLIWIPTKDKLILYYNGVPQE